MAEAERQVRVAQRLHAAAKPKQSWDKLGASAQRRFIDLSCTPEHRDDDGHA